MSTTSAGDAAATEARVNSGNYRLAAELSVDAAPVTVQFTDARSISGSRCLPEVAGSRRCRQRRRRIEHHRRAGVLPVQFQCDASRCIADAIRAETDSDKAGTRPAAGRSMRTAGPRPITGNRRGGGGRVLLQLALMAFDDRRLAARARRL